VPRTSSIYTLSLHDALPILAKTPPVPLTPETDYTAQAFEERCKAAHRVDAGPRLERCVARRRDSQPRSPACVPLGELHLYGSRRSEEHTSELQSRENLVCRL